MKTTLLNDFDTHDNERHGSTVFHAGSSGSVERLLGGISGHCQILRTGGLEISSDPAHMCSTMMLIISVGTLFRFGGIRGSSSAASRRALLLLVVIVMVAERNGVMGNRTPDAGLKGIYASALARTKIRTRSI